MFLVGGEERFSLVVVAQNEEPLFFEIVGLLHAACRSLPPLDFPNELIELDFPTSFEVAPVMSGKLLDAGKDGCGRGTGG